MNYLSSLRSAYIPSTLGGYVYAVYARGFLHQPILIYTRIQLDTGIQGYRDIRIQGQRDTGIQGYMDTGIQGYKDTGIQEYRDTGI